MNGFTHLDESGRARMVDVSDKDVTRREATARAVVTMQPETARLIASGGVAKGDVLAVAQVAGVMAAKRTPDLIPLCHPLPISGVDMTFDLDVEGQRAADIAAILSERGLGGDGIDLTHRLEQFRRDRSRRGEDARRMSKRWSDEAGGKSGEFRRE